jgi:hypothetical protein
MSAESGFGAAAALQEMLLQSQGGVLRVFPAVPPAWPEAAFDNLRAEGAFVVSAVRSEGKTQWVRILSEVGGECRLRTDFGTPNLKAWSATGPKTFQQEAGSIVFDTQPKEEFWVVCANVSSRLATAVGRLSVKPVAGRPAEFHFFGVKKTPRW